MPCGGRAQIDEECCRLLARPWGGVLPFATDCEITVRPAYCRGTSTRLNPVPFPAVLSGCAGPKRIPRPAGSLTAVLRLSKWSDRSVAVWVSDREGYHSLIDGTPLSSNKAPGMPHDGGEIATARHDNACDRQASMASAQEDEDSTACCICAHAGD